jgi:protein tyrosine/serine phosphatase
MRPLVKQRIGLALGLMAAAAVVGVGAWWQSTRLPRRFAPVVDGRLYRSGRVSPAQLERLQRQYGIRRVISLLDADDQATLAEQQAADRLGIEWHNIPLTGDGASTAAERDQLRQLLADPDAPPTLVHCAAGVNRTGLAIGLYRLHCQHWKLEQVLAEMRAFGFEDLPRHENLRQALAAEAEAATAARN